MYRILKFPIREIRQALLEELEENESGLIKEEDYLFYAEDSYDNYYYVDLRKLFSNELEDDYEVWVRNTLIEDLEIKLGEPIFYMDDAGERKTIGEYLHDYNDDFLHYPSEFADRLKDMANAIDKLQGIQQTLDNL